MNAAKIPLAVDIIGIVLLSIGVVFFSIYIVYLPTQVNCMPLDYSRSLPPLMASLVFLFAGLVMTCISTMFRRNTRSRPTADE